MSFARKHNNQPARAVRLAYATAESAEHFFTGSADTLQSEDEFWMIAEWSRTGESLAFHTESLISWAPIEILECPTPIIDETDQSKWLCKFRYFGPIKDRARLIENAKTVLNSLARWQAVPIHSL
ncbi:hypothetical protein D1224_10445 [Henriciella barbarensis]|uniref:Uncharacterized protein n=1 Tax=Henriciella barbarensis TaxID=86342 RepID=A0A399R430_9PROT|nr:hypothetical protein [Henriciella barbarensis]RIJ24617.1 hypothetical protein D1224_10445 [Henriciella barbarensis]